MDVTINETRTSREWSRYSAHITLGNIETFKLGPDLNVKYVPELNKVPRHDNVSRAQAPLHEDVGGSVGMPPRIPGIGTRWR